MTKGTFGEALKREREMRGVSLDEISSATRIAPRFLQAIEDEQWDQLPGGVFNRGFVRAVAHYLGLDEENIVAEYVLAVGDRPSVPVWTGSPPAVTPEQPWAAWIIAGVLVIVLVAGSWFGVRRIFAWRAARRSAQNAAAVAQEGSEDAQIPANIASGDAPANSVPGTSSEANSSPNSVPGAATAISTGIAPAGQPVSDRLELKIAAGKKTKVTVQADSNRVFEGTMKAGEDHTFAAKDRFEVSARDAGAVQLELNGKMLAPIGPSGHSGKTTVTREALKGTAGGQN